MKSTHRHGYRHASLGHSLSRLFAATGVGIVSVLTLTGCPATVDCIKDPQNTACITSAGNDGAGPGGATGAGATGNTVATHQSAASCSKSCASVEDCACGRDAANGACAVGRKECIDASKQCPDFCTGITGKMQVQCVNQRCAVVAPPPDEGACS